MHDWEAIERQYRLGAKSMRMLATEFGVNVSSISRRAKKYGWVQDKTQEVRQRTKAALVAQQGRNTPTREDVEAQVQTNLIILTEHRADIRNGRQMYDLLIGQLHEAAKNRAEIEEEIIEDTKGSDGKPDLRRRNRMLKAISLPAHAGVLRDLSQSLKNLIPLERQAFSIDDGTNPDDEEITEIPIRFVPAPKRPE